MLDCKAFSSLPICLDVEVQKMPLLVPVRKLTCWKCGGTGHLSLSCPEKAFEVLAAADPIPPLAESVISVMLFLK